MYADPVRQKKPRADMDLRAPACQDRLREAIRAPLGARSTNVFLFEKPCGSFSDLMALSNHGTRIFTNPLGTGTLSCELEGNLFTTLAAKCFQLIDKEDKLFIWEPQWPSGRYPKAIDIEQMVEALTQIGACGAAVAMCMLGKAPPTSPRHVTGSCR